MPGIGYFWLCHKELNSLRGLIMRARVSRNRKIMPSGVLGLLGEAQCPLHTTAASHGGKWYAIIRTRFMAAGVGSDSGGMCRILPELSGTCRTRFGAFHPAGAEFYSSLAC